uniref:Uncharacterized protein n=1 Tax=Anguilla anguilla TaxID=7936 RepID=A0A0E9XYJ9_ANGAN
MATLQHHTPLHRCQWFRTYSVLQCGRACQFTMQPSWLF